MKIQVKEVNTGYTDSGIALAVEGKAPLLFVHGYPLNREMWTPQLVSLSRLARVLAPDLCGFGETEPPQSATSMDSYASDLAAFLDALDITRPVTLCGLSMGGYIALAFARNYPDRLHSLILMSTRAAPDSVEAQQNRSRQIEQVKQEGAQAVIGGMEKKLLAPDTFEAMPGIASQVQQIMKSASDTGVTAALAAMRDRPDSRPFLSEIRVPTLVIHGKDDALIPPSEAEATAAAIPSARLELIEAAGHLPNLEQAVRANKLIEEFIQAT